jgi:DNA modification methylase
MSIKDFYINSVEEHNKEKEQRENTFNGMSANEWAKNSKSVWEDLPFPRSESKVTNQDIIQEEVYEKILCMYSKEGDVVLDPFMERGTSIVSCIHNNRQGIGLEEDETKFLDAREAILNSLNLLVNCDYHIENVGLEDYQNLIDNDSIQLCMSSLIYTKEENNITYEDYLSNMDKTFKNLYPKIKQGGYVVFIVRDFRDIKNNQPYVECHNDVARLGINNGFVYQDVIIYNHNGQRGLLLQGYPKVFYVNLNHSYVIVLRKIN